MVLNLTQQQQDDLIRTALAEANTPNGRAAVIYTALNRANDPRWSSDVSQVVHQPKQFSAWNSGAGGNSLVYTSPNDPQYAETEKVLKGIMDGSIKDPTDGATNYYSPSGMNSLVASGSQSNTTPPWLDQANAERGSSPVTIDGQIFTGKSSETGGSPPSSYAYEDSGRPMYDDPTTADQYKQSSSSAEEKSPSKYDQWVSSTMPWLTQSRADKLLAIGSGLLSGDDWASGIGAAGKNLLALNTQNEQRDQANQDAAAAHQRRMDEIGYQGKITAANEAARVAGAAKAYQTPFNITGIDKTTGQQAVMPGLFDNGVYKVIGTDGKPHDPDEYMTKWRRGGSNDDPTVSVAAGDIPGATSYTPGQMPSFNFARESEAKSFGYATRAIAADRDLDKLTQVVGIDKMTSIGASLQQWASQHAKDSLTPAVINSVIAGSGLQGQVAAAMSNYLQAALRDDTGAAYTGTEFNNYGSAYLPSAGDNADTLAYKSSIRKRNNSAMVSKTGNAAIWLNGVMNGQYDMPYQGIFQNGQNIPDGPQKPETDTPQGQPPQASAPQAPPQGYDPKAYSAVPQGFDPKGWSALSPKEQMRAYELTGMKPATAKPTTATQSPNRPPANYPFSPSVWSSLSDKARQQWIANNPQQ